MWARGRLEKFFIWTCSVISYGCQTENIKCFFGSRFESSVISYGCQTINIGCSPFESSVISYINDLVQQLTGKNRRALSEKMTALELMLCVKNERIQIYYHRDTKIFDFMPVSQLEREHIDWDIAGIRTIWRIAIATLCCLEGNQKHGNKHRKTYTATIYILQGSLQQHAVCAFISHRGWKCPGGRFC